MDGIDLYELKRRRFIVPALARSILCDVLAGLWHAHARGVLHCDISLRNIMITRDGTAKLIDFGLAVHLEESSATEHARSISDFQGTLPYASREALECESHTRGSDIYSVGAVFHELVIRYPPYGDGDRLAIVRRMEKQPYCQLPEDFPDDLRAFVQFALGPTETRTDEAVDLAIERFWASPGAVMPREKVAAMVERVRAEMDASPKGQAGILPIKLLDTFALSEYAQKPLFKPEDGPKRLAVEEDGADEHAEEPKPRPRRRARSRLGRAAVAALVFMAAMLLSTFDRTSDVQRPEPTAVSTPASPVELPTGSGRIEPERTVFAPAPADDEARQRRSKRPAGDKHPREVARLRNAFSW